jgi:flavin-dependent dehydrogenase
LMLQSVTWDSIVIGGGPAGAAFALELARNGRRVALIERTQFAHHKVCGEFLSVEAQDLLRYLDLDVASLGATAIDGFRLVTGERHAAIALPFRAAGLSRCRLDEALLASAEGAGVHVVRGARVSSVESSADAVVARTETMVWRGKAAALASGKHSLRGVRRPRGSMVGFKLHLESDNAARALPGIVQLVFFRGGYLGACLVEENILSVGWVMEAELVRKIGADWPAQKSYLVRQSGFAGDLLESSRPLFAKAVSTAGIPYGFLRAEPIGPVTYPLGDQLAVVPSFTGDGMAIALCSGIVAARAVLEGKSAPAFQSEFVGRLKRQFRVAGALGRILQTPSLCAVSVVAANLLPRIAAKMVSATRLQGFENVTRRSTSPAQAPAETARSDQIESDIASVDAKLRR